MRAEPPAVLLDGLARRYGSQTVLRDVNLEIAQGRVVVLQGANGAGKTTLLRVLATRLRPSRGGGSVLGFDLLRDAHEVRLRTALVTVFGGAYNELTAAENLRLAAALYGRPRDSARIEGLLEQVGLAGAADRRARTFSSGMKKRLALARLLLAEARLWLLDEPYAALDEEGKALMDALLVRAKAEGLTVLLASHEPERSVAYADAFLRVEGGRVSLLAPAREVSGVYEVEGV